MVDPRGWSLERVTGFVLVLSSAAVLPGLIMFWIRRGGPAPAPAYLTWERGFIIAAVVLTAIGFVLLEAQLQATGGRALARAGATAYLFGGVLLAAAEGLSPALGYEKLYRIIVIYVVLAFVAQAALGGALLQSRQLAPWIGWATVLWNLAWLVVLPLVTPRDIYFPVLHHLAPLLIGWAMLWRAP